MTRKKSKHRPPIPPNDIRRTVNGLRRLIRQLTAQWEICRFNMELVLPLMRDAEIVAGLDQTRAANAARMLSQTLTLDVVKDCYKLALDRSNRRYTVASIPSAFELVKDRGIRKRLRVDYCRVDPGMWKGIARIIGGSEGRAAKARIIAEERTRLETEFDSLYKKLRTDFRVLDRSPSSKRIRKARNKAIAHAEMQSQRGSLKSFDFTSINSVTLILSVAWIWLSRSLPIWSVSRGQLTLVPMRLDEFSRTTQNASGVSPS
jgi:AbiU2